GCVAGETCMHSSTSLRDRSVPAAWSQAGPSELDDEIGALPFGAATPTALATCESSARIFYHREVVCGLSFSSYTRLLTWFAVVTTPGTSSPFLVRLKLSSMVFVWFSNCSTR